jgi:membrane-associated protease RseP (regulator of RpoE activity)
VTATIAGSLYPFGTIPIFPEGDPRSFPELVAFLLSLPIQYAAMIGGVIQQLATDATLLSNGLKFSLSLLFILISHEMGHYVACRIYGVDATLPFFIPTPPMIGPAGTFGAFIKIVSPMPSRRAVFDIGVAGPIAGFIALLPIAVIGVLTMETVPAGTPIPEGVIVFADPLLMQLIAAAVWVDISLGVGNPFYFAGWVGLLVTALNLIPSGQLDGGHAVYAVLGERVHWWAGRVAFVLMSVLSVVGFYLFNSPSGFLIAVLLGVMLRVGHPQPWDTSPLDKKRKAIALLTLLMFVLSFAPFPIRIT